MSNFVKGILVGCIIPILLLTPTYIIGAEEVLIEDTPQEAPLYLYSDNLTQFSSIDKDLAEDIEDLCNEYSEDTKQCIKHIVGVTSAESSVFKKCSKNNCFGLMKCTKQGCSLRKYETLSESVEDRLKLYQKNNRAKRNTGQKWLDGRYCTSACSHWVSNYNGAIQKLNIQE